MKKKNPIIYEAPKKKIKKGHKEIADQLRALADQVEERRFIHPLEITFIHTTILPALEALLNHDLHFFAIVALGKTHVIQNWINTTNDRFVHEAASRFRAISMILTSTTIHNNEEDEEHINMESHSIINKETLN